MKTTLAADRIIANLMELNGFRTKLQLAEYLGVVPSSVTDWVRRKGNRIPERHLARLARERGLNWEWLTRGEGRPYGAVAVDAATGVELNPEEVRLISRVKSSPQFKRAVSRLLGLGDDQVALLARVAESMAGGVARHTVEEESAKPYRKWSAPLLTGKE